MAKEIAGQIKLQVKGGAANPSPPIGPALGSKGINIMEFCKQFNARTQDKAGKILPVVITYYTDKSFDFIIKTPPVAIQLLEVTKQKSGSAQPNRKKIAEVTWEQVKAIATDKMADLNCFTIDSAMRMVAGTARSMGISVKGEFPSDLIKLLKENNALPQYELNDLEIIKENTVNYLGVNYYQPRRVKAKETKINKDVFMSIGNADVPVGQYTKKIFEYFKLDENMLKKWVSLKRNDSVKLYIGLAAYKIGTEDQNNEWIENTDILKRQILSLRAKNVRGFSLFSYSTNKL